MPAPATRPVTTASGWFLGGDNGHDLVEGLRFLELVVFQGNPELLFEEGGNMAQLPAKVRLAEVLYAIGKGLRQGNSNGARHPVLSG